MSDNLPASTGVAPVDARTYVTEAGGDPSSYGSYRDVIRNGDMALRAFPAAHRDEVERLFGDLPPAAMVAIVSEIGANAPHDAPSLTEAELTAEASDDPVKAALRKEWGGSADWRFGIIKGRADRLIDRIVALGGGAAEGRAVSAFLTALSPEAWKAVLRQLSEPWGVS